MKLLQDRDFVRLTLADFIVRAAYQIGKTPLLPIMAASLGASELMLGLIVSVSTSTGMVAKPLVGLLSDRWGRRVWLLIGTCFFAFVPFLYWLITSPEQLVALRIVHGGATAIYGPVTLAFVAEQGAERRAERLGWFSNARSAGYIIGPALGGLLLLWFSPQLVFTVIGLVSCFAFIPVLGLGSDGALLVDRSAETLTTQLRNAIQTSGKAAAVWLTGGIEAFLYVVLYALKAFLPVYALGVGWNSAEIGLFFAVQEGANMVCKPIGGRLADRVGNRPMIISGMVGLACTLPLLGMAQHAWQMLAIAALIGVWQAIFFPATTALVAEQVNANHLGAGLGLVGTLRNAGKVAGPLIGGVLLSRTDFETTFLLLSLFLALIALVVLVWRPIRPKIRTGQHPIPPTPMRPFGD